MVGRTARLHNDRAFLLLLEERDQVFPLDLAAYHCVSCGVDGVHLEHRLCSVEANHGNAHRGRSLSGCATTGLWHIDAWGRPPQLRRSSCTGPRPPQGILPPDVRRRRLHRQLPAQFVQAGASTRSRLTPDADTIKLSQRCEFCKRLNELSKWAGEGGACDWSNLDQAFGTICCGRFLAVRHEKRSAQRCDRTVGAGSKREERDDVCIRWLRVSGTAEMPQIDQCVGHQFHAVVSLLFELEAQQQPLEFIFPREGPLHEAAYGCLKPALPGGSEGPSFFSN